MNQDPLEQMALTYPVLTDLLCYINANVGVFERDRVSRTLEQFGKRETIERLGRVIAEIDAICENLPMGHEDFQGLANYILPTDEAVQSFLAGLRKGIEQSLIERQQVT